MEHRYIIICDFYSYQREGGIEKAKGIIFPVDDKMRILALKGNDFISKG